MRLSLGTLHDLSKNKVAAVAIQQWILQTCCWSVSQVLSREACCNLPSQLRTRMVDLYQVGYDAQLGVVKDRV